MLYLISALLVLLSGIFSGMTLGLMSLSVSELKRKEAVGDRRASRILTVREQGNLLLTTLLVGNVAVNSALALYLGSITSGVIAGVVSTALIVIFGEIIPQAVFSRFALMLGSHVAPFVRFVMVVLYPVTKPIAWTLDRALGDELPTIYSKEELVKLIEEHEDAKASDVDADEERIVKGALTFSDKTVKDVMTPRSMMRMIERSTTVDSSLIADIKQDSFSRIPIYDGESGTVTGMLYVRKFLCTDATGKTADEVAEESVEFVHENEKLDAVFNRFLKTRHHLFIVLDDFGTVVGLITLEDIIEEIIGSEIVDEADRYEDLRLEAKRRMLAQRATDQ